MDKKVPFDEAVDQVTLARAHRVLSSSMGVTAHSDFATETWLPAKQGRILLRKSNPRRLTTVPNYYLHESQDGPVLNAITLWRGGSVGIHFYHHDFMLPEHLEDERVKLYSKEKWPNVNIDGQRVTEAFGVDVLTAYLCNVLPAAARGILKQGGSSVAERRVLKIARQVFNGHDVLSRWRGSAWLGKLELDVYIPDLQFAVEIQGEQHYRPVWGGDRAQEIFEGARRRDELKVQRCQENGVRLLRIREERLGGQSDSSIAAALQGGPRGPFSWEWPAKYL